MTPSASPLPSTPRVFLGVLTKRAGRRQGGGIGARTFLLPAIDRRHLGRYRAALCGIHDSQESHLPLTYLYLYAWRGQMAVATGEAFPYSPIGMVHVSNSMRYIAPLDPAAELTMAVAVREPETTPSGAVTITLEALFRQGNELVAECVSEYLVRKAARAQLRDASNGTPELVSEWRLDAGAGRRYAALSGDYNPIHLSYLSARAFGFRGAIMQGMYSVARLALEFELRERRRVEAIDAQFLRPVFLPGDIQVFRSEATTFALSQKDKVCANVQVTATPRDRDESGCASAATRV